MSKDNLAFLLQRCLEAYEAGLSPEECLSAFPARRRELEPLLRQALSLRLAFASAPSPELQQRARQSLLFAAGRDLTQAFAAEPEEAFRIRTRNKLVYAAGQQAQEALRDVPPPRLAFWINARRRLLEAAGFPRPTVRPMALAFRSALSAAVVVLALTAAGLAYFISEGGSTSPGAELAALEREISEVEERAASGEPVAASEVEELGRRTNQLTEKISANLSAPLQEKLPQLIERQKDVITSLAAGSGNLPPDLEEAQQQLNQAESRLLAVLTDTPTPTPSSTRTSSATPAASPTRTPTPRPSPTAVPLEKGEIEVKALPDDTTYNIAWLQVRSATISFVVPAQWVFVNPQLKLGMNGVNARSLRIDGASGGAAIILIVDLESGEINALVDREQILLRGEGPDGATVTVEELIARAGEAAAELVHISQSVEVSGAP
jgi:hypothetical protein